MALLLSLAVLAALGVVFGLLVWFAMGLARVEQYRSEDDRKMIAAVKRLDRTEGEP